MKTSEILLKQGARSTHGGFTLVEIMVGLAIGMLAAIVIMQVLANFEAQKRSTTGAADAQTNGSIALFKLQREMQMGGYPLLPVTDPALNCSNLTLNGVAVNRYDITSSVLINDETGANGEGDTIVINYGNGALGGIPADINFIAGNVVTVQSNFGCNVNDTALIILPNATHQNLTCAMTTVTAVSPGGVAPETITLTNNNVANAVAAPPPNISCVGQWQTVTYNVVGGVLMRNGVPSMDGVVSLQAQYGIALAANKNTANENAIVGWVNATGAWANPTVANRNLIKAVRVAIVARNEKLEAANVSNACSSTVIAAPAPTGVCAWTPIAGSPAPALNLAAGDANWQRYSYRVFDTIVPLRNVMWGRGVLQ